MFRRLICVAVCLLSSACASTQLNSNTTDLASSLSSLQKSQILYNLAEAVTNPEFVPSQVTISIGTAQTLNSIVPSVSVPLGPTVGVTNRTTTGRGGGNQISNISTQAAPGLGLQVTDSWTQTWTMVPANSANQLRRLRTIYQYATGTLSRGDPTRDLTEKEAERQFLCDYAIQSLSIVASSPGENVRYRVDGCRDSDGTVTSHLFYADPIFTQGPNCVVCITDLHDASPRPHLNPNLKYHFVRTTADKTDGMISLGANSGTAFYVCPTRAASRAGLCGLVPGQQPFNGRRAFSDFMLFIYEAMSVPAGGGGGNPKASGGAPFVYSVR